MVEVRRYHLPPTKLIPNSPQPVLHYPGFLSSSIATQQSEPNAGCLAVEVHNLFRSNDWQTQWIFRYGATQSSHYHSQVHECMAVLSGTARIRFGVADLSADLDLSTHDPAGKEDGGIEVEARTGDVFILPAGVAHKTFNTNPTAEFALLTPGDGHHIANMRDRQSTAETRSDDSGQVDKDNDDDIRDALAEINLDGFTMMGAYPVNSQAWDFAKGGEHHEAEYERVWSVSKPGLDPVLGKAEDGLCGSWK